MDNKKRFDTICRDIKSVKIQGARNVAKAALYAYELVPTRHSIRTLLSLRPTEPMLQNVLAMIGKKPMSEILGHFDSAQDKINLFVLKLIRQNSIIFTHCHSTNVINALIYAKEHGKKFEVINTETRPLYQGRKTAKQLSRAGIKTTLITDLEAREAIAKSDIVVLGADAILKNGDVINKMGSSMFSEIAHDHKVPVCIIADSWKFSKRAVKIEERDYKEVWKNAPRKIKIKNLAFERIPSKYIKFIVSDLGILKPKEFVKKAIKS